MFLKKIGGVLAQIKKRCIIDTEVQVIDQTNGAIGSIRYRKTLCFFIGGLNEKNMETILVL